jgi:hypothetical protein
MKPSAMIAMAAMVAGGAWAATKTDSHQRLVICLEDGKHGGVESATAKASSMFLSAGVKLEWHGGVSFCKGNLDAMVVSLMTSTPKAFHPGALAYAWPYEGVHIQVFYDRIAQSDPELVPSLMAHVIVHEITHILQGIDRHSAGGIMKAVWASSDYTQMKRGQLRFTAADVEMIHDGFAARAARSTKGAVVAAVAP